MKVLHIIDSFSFGGAERLLATLNGAARARGLEFTVASLAPRTADRTASLPVLVEAGLRPSFVGVRRLLDPTALPRLRHAIRASGCDVVHAHLGYSATLVPLAARWAAVPCVSTLHHLPAPGGSLRDRVKERLWARSAERGAALVFVSEAARRAATAELGPPRPSWRVLRNGVDLSVFRPAGRLRRPLPTELGVPNEVPVVTIVAALRVPKGHDIALQSWPLVRKHVPDAVLLIVGDGPHRDHLQSFAGEGVVFAGNREDVPGILRGSTLALLPSLTEALPTALIEAAASGLAAVATSVGGTPEIVEHERTGLLVPPGNAEALARAVITLLVDEEQRAQYGAAARVLAEQRFDLTGWAEQLARLYAEAVGATGRRNGASGVMGVRGS
jgi:glycosyltransferase involved in cell wall biosynthesis